MVPGLLPDSVFPLVTDVCFLWMKSYPPEMCTAICLFKDILISQVRVDLWCGDSTWHHLRTIVFWSDTISVRNHLNYLPPIRRGRNSLCRSWHCGCGLMKSHLAGCQSAGWAALSWWRSLDTQSRWNTPTMWETLLSQEGKHHLLRHLVFVTCCHQDSYSSMSLTKWTVSSYVNLNDGSLSPSHCAKHSIWCLLGDHCARKPNSFNQDKRGELQILHLLCYLFPSTTDIKWQKWWVRVRDSISRPVLLCISPLQITLEEKRMWLRTAELHSYVDGCHVPIIWTSKHICCTSQSAETECTFECQSSHLPRS